MSETKAPVFPRKEKAKQESINFGGPNDGKKIHVVADSLRGGCQVVMFHPDNLAEVFIHPAFPSSEKGIKKEHESDLFVVSSMSDAVHFAKTRNDPSVKAAEGYYRKKLVAGGYQELREFLADEGYQGPRDISLLNVEKGTLYLKTEDEGWVSYSEQTIEHSRVAREVKADVAKAFPYLRGAGLTKRVVLNMPPNPFAEHFNQIRCLVDFLVKTDPDGKVSERHVPSPAVNSRVIAPTLYPGKPTQVFYEILDVLNALRFGKKPGEHDFPMLRGFLAGDLQGKTLDEVEGLVPPPQEGGAQGGD